MTCSEVQTRIGELIDGELSLADAEAVRRHLDECGACRREFTQVSALADAVAKARTPIAPAGLWKAIEAKLDRKGRKSAPLRWFGPLHPGRVAAVILIAVGLGVIALRWPLLGEQSAEAATVQFRVLLDNVSSNPDQALRKFLVMYQGEEIRPPQAKAFAPALNFELPDPLPGGFRLGAVFGLRFGDSPGIVARYERGDERLIAIFHPPVHGEDYGTHRDYPCIMGQHRGHEVCVGDWCLVHVTDPTTCHCVLSRLDEKTELPQVISAIVPSAPIGEQAAGGHDE